jgi:pimeloyl-ACP methyl ester carboxylesterase
MGNSGPTVILLHGILVSSWSWRFNLDALSRHFRVIALCQKGFGWSGKGNDDYTLWSLARFVTDFMDAKGIEQADLVGNSLGGAVAMAAALQRPEKIRRLVLVDAAGVPIKRGSGLLKLQMPRFTWLYRAAFRPWILRLLLRTLAYKKLPIDDDYMDGFLTPLRRDGSIKSGVSVAKNLGNGFKELFPRLRQLHQPVQLIWGGYDRLVPMRAAQILESVLPNSQLTVFDGCRHCPHEEDPVLFNRAVIDFLSQADLELAA